MRCVTRFLAVISLVGSPLVSACHLRHAPGPTVADHPRILVSAQLGAAGPGLSLYEALSRLHPEVMPPTVRGMPIVYVNGARATDPEVLTRTPAARVRKVELLEAAAAIRRLGAGHEAGAILLHIVPASP